MNKYRKIPLEIAFSQAARDVEPLDMRLDEGIILDQSPQDISPRGSPDLDFVRIEQGALKADWGIVALGAGAPNPILAQGEHRFIQVSTGELIEVHFRLYRTVDGFARIESYDSVNNVWEEEVTGDFEINEVYLSWVSYFDAVFFADGDRVFKWDRSELEQDEGNDFPTTNLMEYAGDEVSVTVTPAGGTGNAYTVHWNLTVQGASEEIGTVVFEIDHNGQILATKTISIPASTNEDRVYSLEHIQQSFTKDIPDSDAIVLRLKSVTGSARTRTLLTDDPNGTTIEFDKAAEFTRNAYNGVYTFNFYTINNEGGGPVDIEFYIDFGSGYELVATEEFDIGPNSFTYESFEDITDFKMNIPSGGGRTFQTTLSFNNTITWGEIFGVEAHGFNLATDLDITNGITYNTTGEPQNNLVLVYEDLSFNAPVLVGRYISLGTFADRLIVLRYQGDLQKLIYCVSGDPTDWTGLGNGEHLLESRSDPVDELMAFAPLTANTGALFRKKSIMRAVQTGNVALPIAFFPWIENIGTESPFSVVIVPGGVCFFGYDKHAYFLAEGMQRPVPLDDHVHEEWEMLVPDASLELVEGWYDPVSSEYNLILPEEE